MSPTGEDETNHTWQMLGISLNTLQWWSQYENLNRIDSWYKVQEKEHNDYHVFQNQSLSWTIHSWCKTSLLKKKIFHPQPFFIAHRTHTHYPQDHPPPLLINARCIFAPKPSTAHPLFLLELKQAPDAKGMQAMCLLERSSHCWKGTRVCLLFPSAVWGHPSGHTFFLYTLTLLHHIASLPNTAHDFVGVSFCWIWKGDLQSRDLEEIQLGGLCKPFKGT